jgi:hypothetical protein
MNEEIIVRMFTCSQLIFHKTIKYLIYLLTCYSLLPTIFLKHIPYGEWWNTTHESYVSIHFLEYLLMLFWWQKLEYIVMVLDLSTCVGPSSCNVYLYRVELSIHYNPVFFYSFYKQLLVLNLPFYLVFTDESRTSEYAAVCTFISSTYVSQSTENFRKHE